jgi:hypothetical protein
MKVIVVQSEHSGDLLDRKTVSVSFNAEVDGLIITISTSPSCGAKLSYQLSVPVLIHTQHVKDSNFLGLGNDPIEHMVTFLLQIGPVNIHLRSDGILPLLDDRDILVILKVFPEPMVMKLRRLLIGIRILRYHRMTILLYIVRRLARVMTIHSP